MKLNGRSTKDDEVAIDPLKACAAWDRFDELRRDRSSDGRRPEGPLADEFNKAIKNKLDLMEADYPNAGYVLAAKQTISKWRQGGTKERIKKNRSVLIAVLSLTGIDISEQGIIARQPINFSATTDLAPAISKRLTNDPEEIEDVSYEITLSELVIKAAEMEVLSTWLASGEKRTFLSSPVIIGTVRYGLREVSLNLDPGEANINETVRRISEGTDPFVGRADGCVMLWNASRAAWSIQPTESSPMRVRLENVRLCTIRAKRGASISVVVSANEEQIHSEFRFKQRVTSNGRVEETASTAPGSDEVTKARERLFSIILAHKLEADSILSFQRLKLP